MKPNNILLIVLLAISLLATSSMASVATQTPSKPSAKELNNALFVASFEGDNDFINKLIKNGAEVNTQSSNTGYTPIMLAAEKGHIETVKLLFKNGANPDIKNHANKNAMHVAFENSLTKGNKNKKPFENNQTDIFIFLAEYHKGLSYEYLKDMLPQRQFMALYHRDMGFLPVTMLLDASSALYKNFVWKGGAIYKKPHNTLPNDLQTAQVAHPTPQDNNEQIIHINTQEHVYTCGCIEEDLLFDDDKGTVKTIATSTTEAEESALLLCHQKPRLRIEDDILVKYCGKI